MEESVQSASADQGQTSSWDPTQGPPAGSTPEVVQWYNQAQQGFQKRAEELNSKYQWAGPYEERLKEQNPEAVGAWLDWYQQLQNDPEGASEAYFSLGNQLGYLGEEDDAGGEEGGEQSEYAQAIQELTQKVQGLEGDREDERLGRELEDAFDTLEQRVGDLPEGIEELLVDRASRLINDNPKMEVAELVNSSYDALQKDIAKIMGQNADERANQPVPAMTGGSEPSTENKITPNNMGDYIHSRLRDHFNS